MKRLILLLPLIAAGCVVQARPAYVEVRPPVVEVDPAPVVVEPAGPVVEGGVVVDVLPPPAERVYLYDPGYPPGCFFFGGFVYYGGYRYDRDVFVDRVVRVNIENRRFIDVERNRYEGRRFASRHRDEFVRNHGRPEHHEEHR